VIYKVGADINELIIN